MLRIADSGFRFRLSARHARSASLAEHARRYLTDYTFADRSRRASKGRLHQRAGRCPIQLATYGASDEYVLKHDEIGPAVDPTHGGLWLKVCILLPPGRGPASGHLHRSFCGRAGEGDKGFPSSDSSAPLARGDVFRRCGNLGEDNRTSSGLSPV